MHDREDQSWPDQLSGLVGGKVVMDTAGTVVFLGTLLEVTPHGFWLSDADLHDRAEGHATKERYVLEAKEFGIRVNRKRLFVLRSAVISISALEEATDS